MVVNSFVEIRIWGENIKYRGEIFFRPLTFIFTYDIIVTIQEIEFINKFISKLKESQQ